MKKMFLAVLICLLFCFSLCSCNNKSENFRSILATQNSKWVCNDIGLTFSFYTNKNEKYNGQFLYEDYTYHLVVQCPFGYKSLYVTVYDESENKIEEIEFELDKVIDFNSFTVLVWCHKFKLPKSIIFKRILS